MNVHKLLEDALDKVERGEFVDAVSVLQLAIQRGSFEAKITLAELYLGGKGVEADGCAAEVLLEEVISAKAAPSKTVALAMNNLACLYMTGAIGVPANKAKAVDFARRAQELGFPR